MLGFGLGLVLSLGLDLVFGLGIVLGLGLVLSIGLRLGLRLRLVLGARFSVRFRFRVRFSVRFRVKFRVRFRFRVRLRVRFRVRFRVMFIFANAYSHPMNIFSGISHLAQKKISVPHWDRNSKSENLGSGTGTRNSKIRDPRLGSGLRFVRHGIPGLNQLGLSGELKNSGTRFRG